MKGFIILGLYQYQEMILIVFYKDISKSIFQSLYDTHNIEPYEFSKPHELMLFPKPSPLRLPPHFELRKLSLRGVKAFVHDLTAVKQQWGFEAVRKVLTQGYRFASRLNPRLPFFVAKRDNYKQKVSLFCSIFLSLLFRGIISWYF